MRINPKDLLLVSIQLLLFIVYSIDFEWLLGYSYWLKIVGLTIAILGLLVVILAILQLNKNFSPFPTPKHNSVLLQNGLFKLVRHPIYTRLIFHFFGYRIYQDSKYKLINTLLLIILFHYKTKYEDKQLQNKFPDYKHTNPKQVSFFLNGFN
jgi:protein-S-isoprenylcysteine O-methyltransferase Ste14